jgi:hypothetical protein
MCFSEQASIVAFFSGIFGSALCLSLGKPTDYMVGWFFIFISLMQVIDYLLWRHQKCDTYNRVVSITGMILNHLQPLVMGGLILFFNSTIKLWKRNYILGIMLFYTLITIPYSYEFLLDPKVQCSIKNKVTKHMNWNWNSMVHGILFYTLFIATETFLIILGMPNLDQAKYFAPVSAASYILSWIFYKKDIRDVGPMWCYFSVFLPIIYYILRRLEYLH